MPLLLAIVGIALLVSAVRNTEGQLATQLSQDVPGFLTWAGAVAIVGAIGYVPEARTFSRTMLALILVVMVIANKGAFANIASVLKSPPQPAQAPQTEAQNLGPLPITISGGGSSIGSQVGTNAAVGAIQGATGALGGFLGL